MIQSEKNIKLIFGLKLKQLRESRHLSLQDLAEKSGLSASYINEIEKGKKYPKAEKIALLAQALKVSYDQLVSLKLPRQQAPLSALLESGFLDDIPLQLFGFDEQKVVELITLAPDKVWAFINTLIEIARHYDLNKEHFYSAMLRSYQELNDNYFKDLEQAADNFRAELNIKSGRQLTYQTLLTILNTRYQCVVDELALNQNPILQSIRSAFKAGKPHILMLNQRLSERQRKFLLAKEIGYHYLKLPLSQRIYTWNDWVSTESFEQTLVNFKASYFAGALLLPEKELAFELQEFFAKPQFDGKQLILLMEKWDTTYETFLHRLTNILPHHFGLNNLFFLRMVHNETTHAYRITKELHLNRPHNPRRNETGEHHCRRWLSVKIFHQPPVYNQISIGLQRSAYINSVNEYLVLSIYAPNASGLGPQVSISLGLLNDHDLRKKIAWAADERIPNLAVNVTCERCGLESCLERAAEPTVYQYETQVQQVKNALAQLTQSAGIAWQK